MRVAIDKNSIEAVKNKDNEYVYIFKDETYQELLELGLHCINCEYCLDEYVDINLTDYEIDNSHRQN